MDVNAMNWRIALRLATEGSREMLCRKLRSSPTHPPSDVRSEIADFIEGKQIWRKKPFTRTQRLSKDHTIFFRFCDFYQQGKITKTRAMQMVADALKIDLSDVRYHLKNMEIPKSR